MSGSDSGNSGNPSANHELSWTDGPQASNSMYAQFESSQEGKNWVDMIPYLSQRRQINPGDFNNSYGQKQLEQRYGQAKGAFDSWLQMQNKTNADWGAYVQKAGDAPGRQGTILTGPASNRTVLG